MVALSMWTRVTSAAACFAAIMGFSRLAYGVLVPAMRETLGGTLALYGAIGGANMIGYLAGSLLTTRLARRLDRSRVNVSSLCAMSVMMAASGFATSTLVLGLLRFAVGVSSGVALALTLSLAVEKITPGKRGVAAAIIWGGGSAGIAIVGASSGIAAASPSAWRLEWIAMGLVGVVAATIFGRLTGEATASARHRDDGAPVGLFARGRYRALAISYFAFGVGYIAVVTFLGAALATAHGMPVGAAWVVLGTAGIVGVALWGPLVDRMRSGVPVAIACACCAFGAVLTTLGTPLSVFAGAVSIGVSFIGIPAMIGALLQQRERPQRYARAFASITVMLGIGQIIGPLVGGVIADRFGTAAAIDMGALSLGFAAAAALCYRRPAIE